MLGMQTGLQGRTANGPERPAFSTLTVDAQDWTERSSPAQTGIAKRQGCSVVCGGYQMTETLFVFDERNYQNCQSAYRGAKNQEYYLGDYSIEAGSVIDVRAEKKAVGSCSIILLKSKSRLFFRRSWYHIREDGTDVTVLWFVKRGRLCVSHQGGYSVAKAGDFVITKSTTPFFIECQTDEESTHEVLHVLVPSHVLRRFLPQEVRIGFLLPAIGHEFRIAERLLKDVFEDTGELAEPTSQLLVDSALAVLSDAIRTQRHLRPRSPNRLGQTLTGRPEVHRSASVRLEVEHRDGRERLWHLASLPVIPAQAARHTFLDARLGQAPENGERLAQAIEAERNLGQRNCLSCGFQKPGAFQSHVQTGAWHDAVRVPRHQPAGRNTPTPRALLRRCEFPAVIARATEGMTSRG